MRRAMGACVVCAALACTGSVGAVFSASAAAQSSPKAMATGANRPSVASLAGSVWLRRRAFLATRTGAASNGGRRATATGATALLDPAGDVLLDGVALSQPDSSFDVTDASIVATRDLVRANITIADGSDPTTLGNWRDGAQAALWALDTNQDGVADAGVVFTVDTDGGLIGGVVRARDGSLVCSASAAFSLEHLSTGAIGRGTYSVTLPAACLGSPTTVAFRADFEACGGCSSQMLDDVVPNSGWSAAVIPTQTAVPDAGGYVVDAYGGLHGFGLASAVGKPTGGPYWKGGDVARGVAMLPSGGGGYVVDAFGGIHGFGQGSNVGVARPSGAPYWGGWDIVRGIGVLPSGRGGYTLDAWGGLHPFAIGENPLPPQVHGGGYWPNWDIARGIAILPDGSGGYVLDGWGGLHPFAIGNRALPARVSGPYWRGWSIARGVAITALGGGYVLDGWGGLHPFAQRGLPAPAQPHGAPYWSGWNVARGITVSWGTPVPPPGAPSPVMRSADAPFGDVVVDGASQFAYASSPQTNRVDVISLSARRIVAQIPVGSKPLGLDLTADGSRLYVADSGTNTVSVVDVASRRELRRVSIPSANPAHPEYPHSVAAASNGVVLVTTMSPLEDFRFDTLIYSHVLQIAPANDAVSVRTDFAASPMLTGGRTNGYTQVRATPDHTKIVISSFDEIRSYANVYDAGTGTIGSAMQTPQGYYWLGFSPSLDRYTLGGEGGTPATAILDGSFTNTGSIPGTGAGEWVVSSALGYQVSSFHEYQKLDLSTAHVISTGELYDTWLPGSSTTLGFQVRQVDGRGSVVASPDGATLLVLTDHGISFPAP